MLDLLEGYAYQGHGSEKLINKLIEMVGHYKTQCVDENLLLVNILIRLDKHLHKDRKRFINILQSSLEVVESSLHKE